jgi:hypothetical protein
MMRAALLAATALCWGAGTARAQGQAVQLNPNRIFSGGPNGLAQLDASGRVPDIDVVNPLDAEYGATGDGATDDTAALQAAANAVPASGGTLLLRGHNFAIAGSPVSSSYGTGYVGVRLHSNTTVRCEGATLTGIGSGAALMNLLVNADFQVNTTVSDHDIKVENCGFSLPATTGTAIVFWFANHVSSIGNTFHGGGDGDAVVGSVDVEETRNRGYGQGNATLDHWWGSSQLRILNNWIQPLAAAAGGNSWGIQVTNGDTFNNNVTMDDILIDGNTVYYPGTVLNTGAGIGIDGSVTGLINHLTITHNHLFNTGTNSGDPNIFLISAGGSWNVSDNILDGAHQIPAIFGLSGNQRDVVVTGNLLSNCGFTSGTYAGNIMLQGQRSTVSNNRQLPSCTGKMVSLGGTTGNVSIGNDDGTGTIQGVATIDTGGNSTVPGRFISTTLSAASYALPGGTAQTFGATKAQVLFPSLALDSTGTFANSTFTAPYLAYYEIDAVVEQNGTGATAGDTWTLSVDTAGSQAAASNRETGIYGTEASAFTIRTVALLQPGDTVKINLQRTGGNGAVVTVADPTRGHFFVHAIQ